MKETPGFQLVTEEEIAAVTFLNQFSSTLPILLNFPFICFFLFCLLLLSFDLLIQIGEGLLYTLTNSTE
jgi:hypothetical protein